MGGSFVVKFKIAGWNYTVKIVKSPLLDEHDRRCSGLCLYDDKLILISDDLKPETRYDVLLHELAHAWHFHTGEPVDEEPMCNNTGSFAGMFSRQFIAQGGEQALMRMTVAGVKDAASAPWDVAAEPVGAQCSICSTLFSPHQVVTEQSEFNAASGRSVCKRSLYCDHCSHVQQWIEGATQAGLPNGRIVAGPRHLKGDDAREFLAVNGHFVGVLV